MIEEKQSLDKKTQEIDRLINKTNSGKNAWKAGNLLFEIKDKAEFKADNYTSFGAYTTNALRISETKAYNYINISKIYSEEEISDLALVSHLIEIADKDQDIREKILEYARKVDNRKLEKKKKEKVELGLTQTKTVDGKTKKIEIRPDYNTEILSITANLLGSAKNNNIPITNNLTELAFECSTDIHERKKILESNKLPNRVGQRLFSKHFPDIEKLFPFQPTNEMGLVALFCVMFFKLYGRIFKFGNHNLIFNSINYVRSEFPDSEINFLNPKNNYSTNLKIEFEFISESFLTHQHLKSKEKCDLIICWENNLDSRKLKQFGVNFPPILSLKKALEDNIIELI